MRDARFSSEARRLVREARAQEMEVTEVARLLGVSRPTVYRLMDQQECAEQ